MISLRSSAKKGQLNSVGILGEVKCANAKLNSRQFLFDVCRWRQRRKFYMRDTGDNKRKIISRQ
jgi:hypothetical protein